MPEEMARTLRGRETVTRRAYLRLSVASAASLALAFAPPTLGQEAGEPDTAPVVETEPGEAGGAAADSNMVSFSVFSEAVTLPALVEFVGTVLEINITVPPGLTGSVVFNTSIEVPKDELLPLLDAMLEQQGFGITYDSTSGFYVVTAIAELPRTFEGAFATTRMIETPNVKPSTLANAINPIVSAGEGSVTAVDELGVIIVTAPPRQIARIESLVEQLLARNTAMKLWPIQLAYVAAPTARERAIALIGAQGADSSTGRAAQLAVQRAQNNANQGGIAPTAGGTLDNLAERLSIDPQGNTLIFRGTEPELERVLELVELVDRPSELEPQRYFVGGAARQIADIARQQGFGEVVTLDQAGATNQALQLNRAGAGQQFGSNTPTTGGPLMVVDVANGSIIYYGTPSQQEDLAELVEELDTESDRVVIRTYRLNYADAETVAEVLQALISGQSQTGQSPFLPQGQAGANTAAAQQAAERARELAQALQDDSGEGGDGEIGNFDPTQVSVIPDAANNQVVIKAPQRQQDDFAELLERLDLRRPQVYVEALIVSVANSEDFRFAVESQLIAGQFGIQSNFGLSGTTDGGTFLDPRTPATGLSGLTSALVKSEYVPFIINAIETDTDARILATPQLLVNDNEEAEIVSLDEEPTTETTFGQTTDSQTFAGFQEAGTTLRVTPSISDAGFLRLEYFVELSNFVGAGSDGIPPPRQTRTVNGQVSIPSDATIVVGGITVENTRNTVAKIPLLGDIPLIGPLFSDTRKVSDESLLYVFITPRIMSDPDFRDIKLFTRGPQNHADVGGDVPPLVPIRIEIIQMRAPDAGAVTVTGRGG